jgi:hypothetical protein
MSVSTWRMKTRAGADALPLVDVRFNDPLRLSNESLVPSWVVVIVSIAGLAAVK